MAILQIRLLSSTAESTQSRAARLLMIVRYARKREAIQVPILEAPGQMGVGKFGWKDQNPTILSFSGTLT